MVLPGVATLDRVDAIFQNPRGLPTSESGELIAEGSPDTWTDLVGVAAVPPGAPAIRVAGGRARLRAAGCGEPGDLRLFQPRAS
jgi:hypothetical protein